MIHLLQTDLVITNFFLISLPSVFIFYNTLFLKIHTSNEVFKQGREA